MNKLFELKFGTVVELTKGKFAIIDEEDYELVSKYKWNYGKNGYASTSVGGRKNKKMIYMHRLIMGVTVSKQTVDHIDGDKTNNTKKNLRICTHRENCSNSSKPKTKKCTSKYKGVYWDKTRNRWTARIKVNYKGIFLGRFVNETEAAIVYNKAAKKHFGKYASLNII